MERLGLKQVATALGQHMEGDDTIDSIVTDSREVCGSTLFVAIEGENFDGHGFINDAFDRGAVAVVARIKGDYSRPERVIYVEDTRLAHIALGALYRNRFDIPVVAITGSVGKTTTKEFVAAVLSSKYNTHKNPGNFNNEIGLPKTLFELNSNHEIAVLEMGMSSLGEIHNLSMAVKPTLGLITNIGLAHLEMLGSQENILKAKLEILDGMPKGAPLILCGDDNFLSAYQNPDYEIITYGITNPSCVVKASNMVSANGETTIEINSPWGVYPAKLPTIGMHNVLNALAAFTVGVKMGVTPEEAAAALKNYQPSGMRQKLVQHQGVTYVEDCYNCSPDSLKAAVLALCAYPTKGRRIMVLSDMLELGEIAVQSHLAGGEFVAKHEVDMLMATGPLAINYIDGASKQGMERALYFADKAELAKAIKSAARPGDMVWIKGSRGMKLEELIEMLYEVKQDV